MCVRVWQGLDLQPQYLKLLIRVGQAYHRLGDLSKCVAPGGLGVLCVCLAAAGLSTPRVCLRVNLRLCVRASVVVRTFAFV